MRLEPVEERGGGTNYAEHRLDTNAQVIIIINKINIQRIEITYTASGYQLYGHHFRRRWPFDFYIGLSYICRYLLITFWIAECRKWI